MKFIMKEEIKDKKLTLADVEVDQFFVSHALNLCQKVRGNQYNVVATPEGIPCAGKTCEVEVYAPITRVLPVTEQIEF